MAFGKLEAAAAASTRPIDGGRRLHVQLWSACIAQPQSDLPGTTNTVGLMRSHLTATRHHPTSSRHPSPQTLRSLSALLRQLRHHHSVTPLRPQPQSPSDLTLSPLSHSLPPSPPPPTSPWPLSALLLPSRPPAAPPLPPQCRRGRRHSRLPCRWPPRPLPGTACRP